MEELSARIASPVLNQLGGCLPHSMAKKRSLQFQPMNPLATWNPKSWDWDSNRFLAKPKEYERAELQVRVDENLSLNLGGSGLNSVEGIASRPNKRGRSGSPNAVNYPMCQVDECRENLTSAKDYHRRHKVCELHSKAVKALVREQVQRFCQQCSRFHLLSEFDEGKRSCRRRLAGHNKRRRKSQPTDDNTSPRPSIPGNNGNSENHSNLDIVNLLAVLGSPHGINNEGRSANRPLVPDKDKIIEVFSKMKTLPLADEKSRASGRDFKDCNMSSPSTLDLLAPLSATPPAPAMDIQSQQSGSYQSSGDTDFHHVPEIRGPHLPLQLFSSQTEEDDSPPRLSVSGKYFSSESSNPSGEMSPSSSPPAVCNLFPIPVSNASSKEEHTRENTMNFNASKANGCFKLFGGSINGTDVVSSTQSPIAYRTGYTSSSGSDHSPSSMSSDPQDRTGRIIFKLFDKNPSHLPGTLRTQIYSWLSNIPSEMESYIRPGCIFISLYLSMPRFVWEHVEEHLCQYADALVKDVDPQFWASGRFLIRTRKRMALHRDGNVRACKLWRKWKSPELICVSPLAIIGGQEICLTLKGRNLNCPNIKINCTHASDYTIRSVHSSAGQDTAHDEIILGNFVIHATSPNRLGRCFIEAENGLGGTTFPVIVSDSVAVCEELRRLESEIREVPKKVLEQENQMATGSREEVVHFLNEVGWLFQRKHNSSMHDFKIRRFKFLLIFSVERDFVEVVKTLLDILLEITLARNASKESLELVSELHILSRAVKRKCRKMVDLLIHYSICYEKTSVHYIFTPNAPGPGAITPLHLAASTSNSDDIVDALTNDPQQMGLDGWNSLVDESGLSPGAYATMRNHHSYNALVSQKLADRENRQLSVVIDGGNEIADHVWLELEQQDHKPLPPPLAAAAAAGKSCSKCAIMEYTTTRRGVRGGPQGGLLCRPYIHSMLAIAAVCACVCILFRGSPYVGSVAPLKWESLDFGPV
ncbi:hypothetical protein DM860_003827 [Cuscuta australis]|uniref:SBP-type domain-containing protein n=1 Tax=Cuscuta australis TaxID=267555 RepID=A0A328DKE9_9ASTE|nr:hypothetical protein DM860_003827 [Cuscuta australis]